MDIFGRFQKINLYLCPPDLGSHFQFSTFNCFTMRIDILSVVPELLESPLNHSIIKRAKEKGIVEIHILTFGIGRRTNIGKWTITLLGEMPG